MSYNWKRHVDADYNRKAAGWGGGSALLGRRAPQGLRFSFDFYVRWAFDNVENMMLFAAPEQEEVARELRNFFLDVPELRECLGAYQLPRKNEDQEYLF